MCSDGVVVDTTAPKPVYLQDGTRNEDADYLPSIRRVRAKYLPFTDPESPMVKYQWKIVTRDTGLDVTPFVNIPLTQRTPMIGKLSLTAGKPYKVILQGTRMLPVFRRSSNQMASLLMTRHPCVKEDFLM